MLHEQLLPLTFGAISSRDSNIETLAKPNGVSCTLSSLPRMSPMVNGGVAYMACFGICACQFVLPLVGCCGNADAGKRRDFLSGNPIHSSLATPDLDVIFSYI